LAIENNKSIVRTLINLKKKLFPHKEFFREKQRAPLSQERAKNKSNDLSSLKLLQITINK